MYRGELGRTLQQVIETFSVIFVKQFDVFNQTENQKVNECVDLHKTLKDQEAELRENEQKLQAKTEMIRSLIEGKDEEINKFK